MNGAADLQTVEPARDGWQKEFLIEPDVARRQRANPIRQSACWEFERLRLQYVALLPDHPIERN